MLSIAAILFISAGCKLIENLHPELAQRGEEFPGSKECSECHIDIYNEWVESSHSSSYTNEAFKTSTNNYEFKFCLGCHVPESIFKPQSGDSADIAGVGLSELNDEEISARSYKFADGVDCQGCHLTVDCTLAGPHAGVSPHPSEKREELYKTSALCGVCHRDTMEEYLAYTEGGGEDTCQDCHMPAVNRKLIQNEPWQKIHVRKEGKAHTFSRLSAIKKNRDFIELKFTGINKGNYQITGNVEITNTNTSHSIPTGKYGYRELLLMINLKDNLGTIIKSKQESMFLELNTQLNPGEKRIVNFIFDLKDRDSRLKGLEAIIFRTNFDRVDRTEFAKVELELDQSKKD
jgi:hypothetical protein